MRILRTVFATSCFVALTIGVNAQWTSSGNNVILTNQANNVGIGKNPDYKLDVAGIAQATELRSFMVWTGLDPINYDGKNFSNYGIKWEHDSWLSGGRSLWISGWGGIRFFAGGTPRMSIHNNGNVGIGKNPDHKLDVAGIAQATELRSFMVWPGYDPITYDGKSFSNYGIKWEHDSWLSGGRSLWISGWGGMRFFTGGTPRLSIHNNGNVGIGHTNPGARLDVNGAIRAHEVRVCVGQWCDYVFEEDYKLMPLSDLSKFIKINKHLPEIAPAVQVEAEGINLGEMNTLLLKKIEELTLYVIELSKKIEILENK